MSGRTLFEYMAFSLVAFTFPWSWKWVQDSKLKKIAIVILTSLIFVLVYLFVLSLLEWSASRKNYDLRNGYIFTLYHSGIFVVLIYGIVVGALYLFGITKAPDKPKPEYLTRVEYKVNNVTSFLSVDEIEFLEANDNYVSIHLDNGEEPLVRQTIREFENLLDPDAFQRIHRKYIINLTKASSLKADPNGGYIIYFPTEKSVKMSKGYKSKLKLLKETQPA